MNNLDFESINYYFSNNDYFEEKVKKTLDLNVQSYISSKSDYLFKDDIIVNYSIDTLTKMVKTPILYLTSENTFANQLLYYYNDAEKKGNVNIYFKKQFREICEYIDWTKIDRNMLLQCSALNEINSNNKKGLKEGIVHRYLKNKIPYPLIRLSFLKGIEDMKSIYIYILKILLFIYFINRGI